MQHLSMQLLLVPVVWFLSFTAACGAALRKVDNVPKKDQTIKDPLGTPVGDALSEEEAAQKVDTQFDHSYSPVSPQAKVQVSPTDPSEIFYNWEGHVADAVDQFGSHHGMKFDGATCANVCAACSVYAAQLGEGSCDCYADCKLGACGDKIHTGWSNNVVSTPIVLWEAQCDHGSKNCEAECLKDTFKKELEMCKKEKGNPTECFNTLAEKNRPQALDARKNVQYCTRNGMDMCEEFLYMPKIGWRCFDDRKVCESDAGTAGEAQTPEAWEAPTPFDSVGLNSR